MTPDLNLRELLAGDINRLRYIKRYSTSLVLHRESVAEHSYYTSLYAMFVADWVNENSPRGFYGIIVLEEVLRRAILHDCEECRTGDVIRPTKHANSEISAMIDSVGEALLKETLISIVPTIPAEFPLCESYFNTWSRAKDESPEGLIVSFADYLSVLSHLWVEARSANTTVLDNYVTLREYQDIFKEEKYNFIRPLVNDAEDIFEEMLKISNFRPDYVR